MNIGIGKTALWVRSWGLSARRKI